MRVDAVDKTLYEKCKTGYGREPRTGFTYLGLLGLILANAHIFLRNGNCPGDDCHVFQKNILMAAQVRPPSR